MRSASFIRNCLQPITENLFMFKDTCNVYMILAGSKAILVDFGSGDILSHLPQGLEMEWVLHTHHHRDQCEGDFFLNEVGAKIAVPSHEEPLFSDVESLWKNRRIFNNYDVRSSFFSLSRNVSVSKSLTDYETFEWVDYSFLVYPTPGHTEGSITLIGSIDGKKVAFCGDLIHTPGKVWNLHSLQWQYCQSDALEAEIDSINRLKRRELQILLPSHGFPMYNPIESLEKLGSYLERLHSLLGKTSMMKSNYGPPPRIRPVRKMLKKELTRISEHLFGSLSSNANSYIVLSENGKCLFVDYGFSILPHFFITRFVEHSIDELTKLHGLKEVDLAIPTHYHDDHIAGIPYLQLKYGTDVWAYENTVDILEHPEAYNIPCLIAQRIAVGRKLKDNEKFRWEESDFTAVHLPGHTEYSMGLFAEVDGIRVLCTGDNVNVFPEIGPEFIGTVAYRNRIRSDGFVECARKIIELKPDLLLTGHNGVIPFEEKKLRKFMRWGEELRETFKELVGEEDVNLGLDPNWVTIYPYWIKVKNGSTFKIQVRIRNHHEKQVEARVEPIVPSSWKVKPKLRRRTLPKKEIVSMPFQVTVRRNLRAEERKIITARVIVERQDFGEATEAIVDISSGSPIKSVGRSKTNWMNL